jgi:hypothetical protein
MARTSGQMQKLIELRDRIAANIAQHQKAIEALQNQLFGVDQAIKTLNVVPGASPPPQRNVKRAVLDIINENATVGVTPSEVVDRAAAKGRTLNRDSVSSLLSRFKRDGVLRFDGERYYPTSSANPQESPLKIVKAANGG